MRSMLPQQHHRLQTLLAHGPALRRAVAVTLQRVDQLHHRGDGGVEGIAPAEVVTDLGDRLVNPPMRWGGKIL